MKKSHQGELVNNPIISVIITTFNRPALLSEAIKSVLSQNIENLEIIIVDDAIVDNGTKQIIFSFKDSRIHYLKNYTNLGSAKSLNIGLKTAKGEYIAILDDDDVWLSSDKLDEQIKFLDKNQNCVLVGTNVVVTDYNDGKEITRINFPHRDEELRRNIFYYNPFAHSSVVYRKKAVLEVGGYNELLERGKDYDLWLKLGKMGKMAVLPGYYLRYREQTSLQRNIIEMRMKDSNAVLLLIWKYRKDYPAFLIPFLRQCGRLLIFSCLYLLQKITGRKYR
ncbi:MAG: glycosyltransferase [bacterium]|nr:glycosyltransferase [bacterium]